jgi:hypothetical protein
LLFGSNLQETNPFHCTNDSIEFVFHHLHCHGIGFLLSEDLDEFQLDLLVMITLWSVLHHLHDPEHDKPDQYPSDNTVGILSKEEGTAILLSSTTNDDGPNAAPSFLETACKNHLHHTVPSCNIDFIAINQDEEPVHYQYSLPIPGCLSKHHWKCPAISGRGYMGAILSNTETFLAFIEFMLCYHTWCHYSHQL